MKKREREREDRDAIFLEDREKKEEEKKQLLATNHPSSTATRNTRRKRTCNASKDTVKGQVCPPNGVTHAT
jgi:hypothetical protein